jgi:hypothetical protein
VADGLAHLTYNPARTAAHGRNRPVILDRLGFRSRSQIAVWATERGLVEDAHVSFR